MGVVLSTWTPAGVAGVACGRREGSARCDLLASANPMRLWMVALYSSILSAAGGKYSNSRALAIASATVPGMVWEA